MRWVSLVRNVMLGREGLHRLVLLDVVGAAGCSNAQSHLTTGNVSFDCSEEDIDEAVAAMEAGVESVIGRHEMVAVRSLTSIRQFVEVDRFAGLDPTEWQTEVAFVRHDAPAIEVELLGETGRTVVVEARDRELLVARPPSGPARPHVNLIAERATRSPATSRGWSTLQRIVRAH